MIAGTRSRPADLPRPTVPPAGPRRPAAARPTGDAARHPAAADTDTAEAATAGPATAADEAIQLLFHAGLALRDEPAASEEGAGTPLGRALDLLDGTIRSLRRRMFELGPAPPGDPPAPRLRPPARPPGTATSVDQLLEEAWAILAGGGAPEALDVVVATRLVRRAGLAGRRGLIH